MEKEIKRFLKKKGIRPQKKLGQNFLISKEILKKIIKESQLKKSDLVLEVGAGIGILTQEIAKRVKKVIAVEKDKKLVEILKEKLRDFPNVQILEKDILAINFGNFFSDFSYKVIGNLPYYLTSPLLKIFLQNSPFPQSLILMVQKEVGERICSLSPKMSKLGVICQFYGKCKILSFVSKKAFWPQPQVESLLLKIVPKKTKLKKEFRANFLKIVKAGFSQPRKKLINNLSHNLLFSREELEKFFWENKIALDSRAENLNLTQWIRLAKTLKT